MAILSASFSDTEGKGYVDDEVLLIEEHYILSSVNVLIFRDRKARSSPCLFVYIVRHAAAYIKSSLNAFCVISDVRVTWERVSQKLNILTTRRRGPQVAMG